MDEFWDKGCGFDILSFLTEHTQRWAFSIPLEGLTDSLKPKHLEYSYLHNQPDGPKRS